MESADATVAQARQGIRDLEATVATLKGVLESVTGGGLSEIPGEATSAGEALDEVRDKAAEVATALGDVKIGGGQTATFTAETNIMAADLDRVRDKAIETQIALDALRGPNGAIPLGVTPSGLPGQTAGPAGGSLGYYDQLVRQQTADFQTLKDDLSVRDAAALDALRTPGGGIALDSGDFSRTIGSLEEYRDLQREILNDQRSASGGIVLPNASSGFVGGDEEYQRFREELLNSQRTSSGAIALGPGAVAEDPGAVFRRDLEARVAAAGLSGGDGGDRAGALNYLRSRGVADAEGVLADAEGGGGFGRGGPGGERGGSQDPGFGGGGLLAGLLPGGRRARPAAIFTALGVAASTGPVLAPAAVAGGAALAAGLTTLIGTAATLKLAFDGITSAAFKSQKAFDALTPVQQDFVSQLRDVQYGFLKPLESVAQQTTLPGITSGIRAAITPASTQALTSGVAAFGGAIGGGAKELGDLFGSNQFANSLGAVIQADAGYLRDFASIISNLVDGFVHLSQAAIPLTDSLDKGVLAFSKWLDNSIKAAQASGQLASYFNKAEVALHSLGDLVGSVGDAFGAFFGDIGFQNSLGVIQTFRDAFEGIAQILNQNKTVLRDFFAGAIGSAQDIISVIRTMSSGLRPVLSTLNSIANLIGGWRVVIDAVVAAITLKLIPGFLAVGPAAETATAESSILFTSISAGSDAALASVSLLRTALLGVLLLPTAYQFGKNLGQALFGGGDNQAYLAQLAAQSALAPGQFVNAQGQIIGKDGKPTGQIVLQPGEQTSSTINTVLPPSINAAVVKAFQDHNKAALAKADAQARAYYKGQEAYASSQDDINTLQGYIQEYTPGGGTPPPLGNTRSTVLPTDLQTALDAATSNVAAGGPKSQEVTALNNAIAYINAIKKKTDADYQERTSLYNQLASLTGTGSTATPTGLGVLPPALQGTLSSAQTAAAAQSPVAGTFNSQDLAAQRALHAQDIDALKNITEQIGKQAAGSKELRALEAERLALTHERNTAEKAITEELKSQKETTEVAKFHKILGISADGSTPTPGATSLGSRERQILLEDAKTHGIATAGLVNEPLSQLVKTLSGDGALPKSSIKALSQINALLDASLTSGIKLDPASSAKVEALLTQINDTLKGNSYASNYVAPSADALTAGLGLSPDKRKIAEERLASFYGHGGKVPTNLAGAGVPLGAFETTPPPVGESLTVHGDVNLIVQYAGDGSRFVQELRSELIKTTKRNGSQTKGPNAGRRQGL